MRDVFPSLPRRQVQLGWPTRLDACLGCLLRHQIPRTEDAAAESDSSNATLCGNCSKALQKPLMCARCKTATYCSKDSQVHTAQRKRGGLEIKAVIN